MHKNRNASFFIIIMALISGCSQPNFCDSRQTITIRKTNGVIDKDAEKYLGEITSVLDGGLELTKSTHSMKL